MNTTNNKMQFLIDKYNSKTLDYILNDTGYRFGTVCMPTGSGKSAVVYSDIINTIDTNTYGQKLVFNISCPILKLSQQFISDLMDIMNIIYKNKRIVLFINSSDTGINYQKLDSNIPVKSFSQFKITFIKKDTFNIAIIASCHKSLSKYVNRLKDYTSNNIKYITYIDESHLLSIMHNNEDDNKPYIDIKKLCKFSYKVYSFSATPDMDIVKKLNNESKDIKKLDGSYIYHMKPIKAINDNIILPPYINYIKTSTECITVNMLFKIMDDAINKNPNINHKILVTLTSSEQLKNIREELESENSNIKVFSTCSEYGYDIDESKSNYSDITEFIHDIDTYDGNCFVLHIRQLIQGIDIKSLTDCVIWSANNGSNKHYRHTIQTIGRVLRPLAGERGVIKSKRKKPVGNVYFISPIDNDDVEKNMTNFLCNYYGFDNIEYSISEYKQGGQKNDDLFKTLGQSKKYDWDNAEIKTLLINIENYINEQIAPKFYISQKYEGKFDISSEANMILRKFNVLNTEWDSSELLDNKTLLDKIFELFKKHNIELK